MNATARDRLIGSINNPYGGAGEATLDFSTLATAAGYVGNKIRITTSASGVFAVTVRNGAAPAVLAAAPSGSAVAQRACRILANSSVEWFVEDCTHVSVYSSVAATIEVTLVRNAPEFAVTT